MNRSTLVISMTLSVLLLGLSLPVAAKEGFIVKGQNGTKWCCPPPYPGVIGPLCNKSDNPTQTPDKAHCNFAGMVVVTPVDPTAPLQPVKPNRDLRAIEAAPARVAEPAPARTLKQD